MRAGRLNKYVTIQEPIRLTNDYGEEEIKWIEFSKVWAGVSPLSGREFFNMQQVNNANIIRVTIRYISNIKDTFRILYGDRILPIKHIIDKNEKHTYQELICEEIT